MKIDHILAMVVACFATLVTTLFLVDPQTVFDPPYLLPILNTLFLAIIPCTVAYTAARLFLSFGSVPLLILGKGMLALGLGGAISGWFIGNPSGPNTTVTIYNCGALLCAGLNAYSALAMTRHPQRRSFKRPFTVLALSWLGLTVIFGGTILAAIKGITPLFIIQGYGPTLAGKAVLVGAILLFMASAALILLNREVSGITLFRCYAAGLILMGIGLTGVLLQHYVGSPLGWAGRSAQYAGAISILYGIAGLWKLKFVTGKTLVETAEEIALERIKELERISKIKEFELGEAQRLTHIGSWYWDAKTDITTGSDELLRIYGFDPGTQEMPPFSQQKGLCYPVESWEKINAAAHETLQTGIGYELDVEAIRAPAVKIWITTRSEAVKDSAGRITGLRGTVQDITDRRETYNKLCRNEERLQLALDAAHLATWDWDILTGSITWNSEHYRMLGYEPGSFDPTYHHWADRLHPDDLPATEENIRTSMAAGNDYRAEFRVILPDGSVRVMESLGRFEHDSSGRPVRCYGAMRDITERALLLDELNKAREELEERVKLRTKEVLQANINLLQEIDERKQIAHELSHSKQALAEAQSISHVGSWQLKIDEAGEHWTGSEELYRIYEYPPDMPLTMQTGLDRIHPDDFEYVKAFWSAAFAGPGPCEWEHRIVIDDRIKWLSVKIRFNFDSEGNIEGADGILQDITQLKQAETEREQFHKFFLTSADIMVIADPNGAFLKINPAGLELLGYTEAELVAQPFIDFVHPDDRQPTLDEMARQQLLGSTLSFVNRYLCKDGSVRCLSWRAVYNRDENLTFAVGRDITEKIRLDDALRKSEAEFRLLAEAMPQIVWITRPDGWNIYFNRQWMEYTGMTLEESLGHGWNKPFHPDDQQVAWHAWQNATQNLATYSLECRLRRADGVYKWWLIRGVPVFDEQGAVIKWFGTCTDIDEFKKAEEERLSLEKQLLHTQKLESLGILAGGIAHDFNNILMAILGNAELARTKLAPESPIVANLQQIDQAALRAADLAKQMLAYSGKGKFVVTKLDLTRLVKEMVPMLEVSISKKVLLNFNLDSHIPAIEADSSQIQQVIMNLVINASEALGDKSGLITISTGSMLCTADYFKQLAVNVGMAEGSYVFLEITDTGCGMDKETKDRIFDPFFTTKFTGRGLGMAAVHGIVRGHKGGIDIYSVPGKGTTFKVLLPAADKPADMIDQTPHTSNLSWTGTVLLVDDEELVRNVCSEILESLGMTVITACDGLDALEKFRSRENISLVILDLTMPHMDGVECYRKLYQQNPEVKVVISSGYNEQEVATRFEGMSVKGFIQKPFTFSAIKEMLKTALSAQD